MKADVFNKIKNREINNTFPYSLNESNNRQDSLKIKTYENIMSLKAEGHITGIKRDDDKEGERANYWALRVTEDGLRHYASVKQLLKPTLWERVKNVGFNSIIKFILSFVFGSAIFVKLISFVKSFFT